MSYYGPISTLQHALGAVKYVAVQLTTFSVVVPTHCIQVFEPTLLPRHQIASSWRRMCCWCDRIFFNLKEAFDTVNHGKADHVQTFFWQQKLGGFFFEDLQTCPDVFVIDQIR